MLAKLFINIIKKLSKSDPSDWHSPIVPHKFCDRFKPSLHSTFWDWKILLLNFIQLLATRLKRQALSRKLTMVSSMSEGFVADQKIWRWLVKAANLEEG